MLAVGRSKPRPERNCQKGECETEKSANRRDDKGFSKHKEKDRTITEADCFEHGKFAGALTHRDGHSVAGYKKQSEEDYAADGYDQELNISELFYPASGECGFSIRLGFKEELAAISSMVLATLAALSGLSSFTTYQPVLPLNVAGIRSSK